MSEILARKADWAVVEQDNITGSVTDALRASRNYLREMGIR
jgi:hypothetical protein